MYRQSTGYTYRLPGRSTGEVVPAYALASADNGTCGCGGRCGKESCSGSGMLSDVANAVRGNPIAFLIGAFALGYVLKGKK